MKKNIVSFIILCLILILLLSNVYAEGYVLSDIDSYLNKVVADLENSFYQRSSNESYNPYTQRYFRNGKQCVGYALARAEEKIQISGLDGTFSSGNGKDFPYTFPNGKTVVSYMTGKSYTINCYTNDKGENLKSNSYASFNSSSKFGHVIFVEEVIIRDKIKYIYYTEAGGNLTPGVLRKKTLTEFLNSYNGYIGCVTLTTASNITDSDPPKGGFGGGSGGGGFRGETVPISPTGLTTIKASEKTARISWKPSSGSTTYEVQYYCVRSATWKIDPDYINRLDTSYISTGLGLYNSYKYRIRAVNSAGASPWVEITYIKKDTNSINPNNSIGIVTVQYNANGCNNVPASHSINKGNNGIVSFKLSSTKPTENGYTFLGWRLENSTEYDINSPGQSITIDTGNERNTILTYYAQWGSATTFTITYDANGGIGAPPSERKNKDESWIISSIMPIRDGYSFEGWALSPSTSYAAFNPGNALGLQSDVTIYAIWKKISTTPVGAHFLGMKSRWYPVTKGKLDKFYSTLTFAVGGEIYASHPIEEYGIILLDSDNNQIAKNIKFKINGSSTSAGLNIYAIDSITDANSGRIESSIHNKLIGDIEEDNTYYWYAYVICGGQRIESQIESFTFTIRPGL